MRAIVDPTRCQGHTRCNAVAPQVFDLDDDGHSIVTASAVPVGLQAAVRRAVDGCPERAISIEMDATNTGTGAP